MLLGSLFIWRSAGAATATLVPNSDATSAWPTCSPACQAAMQYSYVDEGTTANTSDWIGTGTNGSGGEVVEFGLTTAANVANATQVVVNANLRSVALQSDADTVGIAMRVNGTLQAVTTVTMTTTFTNYQATFSGNWSQADVDSMQIYLIRNVVGGGSPSGRDDDVQLANAYATLTYTAASTFEQSAYRWFENQDAATATTFLKTYGSTNQDYSYSLTATDDGGYVTAGATASYGAGSNDMIISKYSSEGSLVWSRTWGGTGSDVGYGVTTVSDGGYVVTGLTASYGSGNEMFTNKYTADGTLSWSRTWGAAGVDAGFLVSATADGGAVVVGRTSSFGGGSDDMFIVKYASNGTAEWSRTWGGINGDIGRSVKVASDGSIYVTGDTGSFGSGGVEMFIVKYDSSGTHQWSRTWGGALTDAGWALDVSSDNHIYVTGQTTSFGTVANDGFLVKYDSSGAVQWSRTWGSDGAGTAEEVANSIDIDGAGNILIGGNTSSYSSNGSNDAFLVKFDANGTRSWATIFGDTGAESNRAVLAGDDGNYLIAGATDGYGSGGNDIYLAKYDPSGVITGCSSPICRYAPVDVVTTPSPTSGTPSPTHTSPTPTVTTPSATTQSPTLTTTTVAAVAGGAVDVGAAKAAQNTPATLTAETPLRLRMSLHIGTGDLDPASQQFKLQVATRGTDATCDTGFSGESYVDVSPSSGAIRFYNNQKAGDGQSLIANANDPTHAGHTSILQSYEESNNFSVATATLVGQDALWDFSLVGTAADPDASYCFRIVKSDGSTLNTYTVIPELNVPSTALTQSAYRFYQTADSLAPGSPIATQNTPATVGNTETPFRLRQRVAVDTASVPADARSFKLQYAERSGVCDTGFSGEIYRDIPTALAAGGTVQKSAGGASNLTGAPWGSKDWSNPGNVSASDNSFASHTAYSLEYTNYLATNNHGFAIPPGATITNISVSAEVSSSGVGFVNESSIMMLKNGQPVGDDIIAADPQGAYVWTSTETVFTWDGGLWGTTWTPADINGSDFGVAISAGVDDPYGEGESAFIDHVTVTVQYTGTSGTAFTFFDNAAVADGGVISPSINDPAAAGRGTSYQTYQESLGFTNPSAVAAGDDGLWDFSLTSTPDAIDKVYCFRVVESSGALLQNYTYIPEITIGSAGGGPTGPSLNQHLRGGQSVIDGVKNPFSW